ncbi:CIC11C00000004363 [Sungouiella intermedia]|uniref:CIC11C00000004363 n=1 Tax=Sungouiella intermedia TaxID=45354 RepID=A0A1L0C439_9ASCO|nr:CIC11C00000004363 [[Candida] intermedia]
MSSECIWYKSTNKLKIGGVSRYKIRFESSDDSRKEIYLRIKNLTNTSLRAIHLLNGPLAFYCHVIPGNYSHRQKFSPTEENGDSEVYFRNSVKPGQTCNVKLLLNKNSLVEEKNSLKIYEWYCDVVSQIVLNRRVTMTFILVIGDDLPQMRMLTRSTLTNLSKGNFQALENERFKYDTKYFSHPGLNVDYQSEVDIWSGPPPNPDKPIHLVILTHGIFSNLTADMLYVRDELSKLENENVVVEGYRENAGRTEKGIHRLGAGVSNYVTGLIEEYQSNGTVIDSISFVGHSLGGPVQLYALKHILQIKGNNYFQDNNIKLRHFVCMASPMLGVLSEMSLLISWFLDLGTLGKTGRDLTLLKKLPHYTKHSEGLRRSMFAPVLETLPDEPIHTLLKQFELRTVYANAVNDGIVPLRTSALLYLDWEAMGDVNAIKENNEIVEPHHSRLLTETNASGNDVGEVEDDSHTNIAKKYSNFLTSTLNINGERKIGSPDKKRHRLTKRARRYAKINAKSSDSTTSDVEDDIDDNEADTTASDTSPTQVNIPPKASAVESAFNTLLCPMPSSDYIMIPDTRSPVIFHDKYYHFSKIPPEEKKTGGLLKFFKYTDWRMDKQVKIARKYHAPELSWRKVLVKLPPDAHNNIVVRRRFANGYGWGVIDHLTDEIFSPARIRAKI